MKQRSRFNEHDQAVARDSLSELLNQPVLDGRQMVDNVRSIIRHYIDFGGSPDDELVSSLLGIESETDDMITSSGLESEFSHVFSLYKEPFEEARREVALAIFE
jgi:hypothetical protein